MASSHVTSASIPRFQADRFHSPFPADPKRALRTFSMGLELRVIEEGEVREWARAFSVRDPRAPPWVWRVREPHADVRAIIHDTLPFVDVSHRIHEAIALLCSGIEQGRIDEFDAGRVLRSYKVKGRLGMVSIEELQPARGVPPELLAYHRAADRFTAAWTREDFFRTTNEARVGPEDTPDLTELFRQFRSAWEAWYPLDPSRLF